MKNTRPNISRLVALGSARIATKAAGGFKLTEPNMVFRYE